jgi:hypothetical protein
MLKERPKGTKTKIIAKELEDLEFYADLKRITELRARGSLINANPNKDTPLFTIVQWSKFELLEKGIYEIDWPEQNVAWIDFGLHYIAKDFDRLVEIIPRDNMKLLCLRPTYKKEIDNLEFFKYINGRTGGGILCAPMAKVTIYSQLFRETKNMFLSKDFSPLEDEIITYMRVSKPELFDLYYGDYENIVQNFNNECWSGDNIIGLAYNSCIENRDFETIKILSKQIYRNRKNLLKITRNRGNILETEIRVESKIASKEVLREVLSIYLAVLSLKKDRSEKREKRVSKIKGFLRLLTSNPSQSI